jgi:hypothetical protein
MARNSNFGRRLFWGGVALLWVASVLAIATRPALVHASGIVSAAIRQVMNAGANLPFEAQLNFSSGGCVDNPGAQRTDCATGATPGGIGVIFSQTNTVTDAGAAETTLTGTGAGTLVIPANFWCSPATGTVVNFQMSGVYSTTAAPVSLRIRLKTSGGATGTVNLGDTGVATGITASVTNGDWRLWGSITCRTAGVDGTLIVNTRFEMSGSSLAALTPADISMPNAAALTVDTTAAQTIDLTALWGAAGQSISSTNYVLAQPGGPPAPQFGTFAAQPSCTGTMANLVYYFTNSAYQNAVCNGTAWTYFGYGQQLTPPPAAGWTADNGATFSFTNGYGFLTGAATGLVQLRTQFRPRPGVPPYTVTALINADFSGLSGTLGDVGYAIGFRDGTGKYVALLVGYAGGGGPGAFLADDKWTNATTLASTYLQSTIGGTNNCGVVGASFCPNSAMVVLTRGPLWLRVTDDSVNLVFSYSIDGQDFTQWDIARSRTDFLAGGPTQIFVGAYALGGPVNLQLISWTAQ